MIHTGRRRNYARIKHPELRELLLDEHRIAEEAEALIPTHDPQWLRLPFRRRQTAMDRIKALLAYERDETGGVAAAEAAAARLQITLRQFYGILKAWKARRSAWALVPYAERVPARIPKLDPEIIAEIGRRIEDAGGSGEARSPQAIARRVLENWPEGWEVPSFVTVRAHVDRQIRAGVLGERPLRLNDAGDPQEEIESASRFGEVLVVDHTAPDIFLDGHDPARPVLTLAIDLHTGAPAGFALGQEAASPELVLDALADAERRSAARSSSGTIKPRLVLATTSGAEWRTLAKRISEADLTAAIRWGRRLHAGGPTSRLIGSELSGIPLKPRKLHAIGRNQSDFDKKRHPLLTLDQAKIVLEDAVEKLAAERLAGAAVEAIDTGLFDSGD